MNTIIHKADSRGHASHGWLDSWHTFSFAGYHHPGRIHFGTLRVLNDDTVAPGMGFGRHPHDNMEIISIPLEGALEHQDSMGNTAIIRQGDIQAMSAGTGVVHSEKNHHKDRPVKFLQIWVFPNKRDTEPRYHQIKYNAEELINRFRTIVSPLGSSDGGVEIQQDAWFHLSRPRAGQTLRYQLKKADNGVYLFMLEGEASVAGEEMGNRDGMGISNAEELEIVSKTDSFILLMEVPMTPLN